MHLTTHRYGLLNLVAMLSQLLTLQPFEVAATMCASRATATNKIDCVLPALHALLVPGDGSSYLMPLLPSQLSSLCDLTRHQSFACHADQTTKRSSILLQDQLRPVKPSPLFRSNPSQQA